MNYGYICAFIAAIFWALLGPLGRLPMEHGISPLEIAFWRAAFGACCFIMHGMVKGLYHIKTRDAAGFALFGSIGIAAFFVVYQFAVQRAGVALSAILLYTAPFWVAVFSRLFFKETLTPLKLAALLLAMAGVALVCLSGGGLPEKTDMFGVGYGLLSGLCYSSHYVFGKLFLARFSSVTIYMYCLPFGALLICPFVSFSTKGVADWLCLLALGFISTYAAYFMYCEALKRLSATRVAVLCNVEPILAALLAYVFWGELFNGAGLFGAALVIIAIFLIIYPQSGASGDKDGKKA